MANSATTRAAAWAALPFTDAGASSLDSITRPLVRREYPKNPKNHPKRTKSILKIGPTNGGAWWLANGGGLLLQVYCRFAVCTRVPDFTSVSWFRRGKAVT